MSLKERCLRYLKRNQGTWFAKGKICDLARASNAATGEHTGRRLRELAAEGLIEVKIEKGHAYYRYTGEAERKRLEGLAYFDSLPEMPVKRRETGVHYE